MSNDRLEGWDVIHAFPTSGKSALVLSRFNELGESLIDTDVILFGYVMPNKIQHQFSDMNLPKPWKQNGPNRYPLWKCCEAMAMQLALVVANKIGQPVLTNLVGTFEYLDPNLAKLTIGPKNADIAWENHLARYKNGQKDSLTDEHVIRSWFDSYKKHTAEWKNVVTLDKGEHMCDYFGVDFDPNYLSYENEYYKWVYSLLAEEFPDWNVPKWAERIPSRKGGQQ